MKSAHSPPPRERGGKTYFLLMLLTIQLFRSLVMLTPSLHREFTQTFSQLRQQFKKSKAVKPSFSTASGFPPPHVWSKRINFLNQSTKSNELVSLFSKRKKHLWRPDYSMEQSTIMDSRNKRFINKSASRNGATHACLKTPFLDHVGRENSLYSRLACAVCFGVSPDHKKKASQQVFTTQI
jgi:hypothetical protein